MDKEYLQVVKDNLIIWRALNMIHPNMYKEPINDGQGIGHRNDNRVFSSGSDWTFTYFHNDWNYLIGAALLVNTHLNLGAVQVTDMEILYKDLINECKKLTKDLPEIVWVLENSVGHWIARDYKLHYSLTSASGGDSIPSTTVPGKSLQFDTKLEAEEYLSHNFQARHGCHFKAKKVLSFGRNPVIDRT